MSTIADRMDVVADGLEEIGQVDWAATLRGLAADVRVLEDDDGRLNADMIRELATLGFHIPKPDTTDRDSMIRERGDIARALDLPTWGTNDHY